MTVNDQKDQSDTKFGNLLKKAKLVTSLDIKNILILLDGTQDRISFVFGLTTILSSKVKTTKFQFLPAYRCYASQAKATNVNIPSIGILVDKIKSNVTEKDIFNVVLTPDDYSSPINLLEEVYRNQHVDLIVVPYPFTRFAKEERVTETSAGQTIDGLISLLFKNSIPILFIKEVIGCELPINHLSVIIRSGTIRSDLIAWFQYFATTDSFIHLHYSNELNSKDIERVTMLNNLFHHWTREEKKNYTINFHSDPCDLTDRCLSDKTGLLIFRAINNSEKERKTIMNILKTSLSHVLIFPNIII